MRWSPRRSPLLAPVAHGCSDRHLCGGSNVVCHVLCGVSYYVMSCYVVAYFHMLCYVMLCYDLISCICQVLILRIYHLIIQKI